MIAYLASPYTHADWSIRVERFADACRAAAYLMSRGVNVLSPVAHSHPIGTYGNLPTTWEWWQQYDTAILAKCDKLIVLQLDGWQESVGVQAEIELARKLGKVVEFMEWPKE